MTQRTCRPLRTLFTLSLSVVLCLFAFGCSRRETGTAFLSEPSTSPTVRSAGSDAAAEELAIRQDEERVRLDPEDFVALNRLAEAYLQHARETGSADDIVAAAKAAQRSLSSVPDVLNTGGLAALTQAEFASHDFAAARDHAVRLSELDPAKSYSYGLLGDALLELGSYDEAAAAFTQMQQRSGGISHGSEARLARLAFLRGDTTSTTKHLTTALNLALNLPVPPREPIAWYRWQLGETAFATGNYKEAERRYRDALRDFPGYVRADASLGRVLAARGDTSSAIKQYESVVNHYPSPVFVAALGDLYAIDGRAKDAKAQYVLVEAIAKLSAANGALYNRQLAIFYADHNIKADLALANAAQEYKVRRDIYGADALAWTALKAGEIEQARTAMQQALRLGTNDATLFFHAGMIAKAAHDYPAAQKYLSEALQLNPHFAPLHDDLAREALKALNVPNSR